MRKVEWLLSFAHPAIGPRPIAEIGAAEVLAALRGVESRGRLETARRLRATIGEVFRFAVATGRAENDPTGALRGALAAPTVDRRAAIIEPKAFGGFLRALAGYDGEPETRAALELLALTFVRPGELRAAEWAEFRSRRPPFRRYPRKNEDEASAPRPARAARRRDLARASRFDWPRLDDSLPRRECWFQKRKTMTTKRTAENEKTKREYLKYLREAKGRDEASLDQVAKAL